MNKAMKRRLGNFFTVVALMTLAIFGGDMAWPAELPRPLFSPSVKMLMRAPLFDVSRTGAGRTSGGGGGGSTLPVVDTTAIVKGSADATKLLAFEVDGFSTGTTRTITFANLNQTVAHIETTSQSFAGRLLMSNQNGIYFGAEAAGTNTIKVRTEQTPDTGLLTTGTTSNAWVIMETQDEGTDLAVPAQTNPTLVLASATAASGTQRMFIRHNQTQGQVVDGATTAANARPIGFMGGSAVASAATITPTGNLFHVTGTTGITAITSMASGTCITIVFDGALAITDSATLNIGAAYTTSADDTLVMCSDGTNWYETGRSVN